MNAAIISVTDKPDNPGNEINKNNTPQTTQMATIKRKPCKKVSILKAAINANKTNANARIFINICKYAYSMLS
jgi:hypothetical protein